MPTRRAFLSQLLLTTPPVVEDAGRHTLVCVFLRGGADTLNLLVPHGDDSYYKQRPTLAIASPTKGDEAKRSLKLDDRYALHPVLKPLAEKFVRLAPELSFPLNPDIRPITDGDSPKSLRECLENRFSLGSLIHRSLNRVDRRELQRPRG